MDQHLIEKLIAVVASENNRPIPVHILQKKFAHLYHYHNYQEINTTIQTLVDKRILKQLDSGSIVLGYVNGPIQKDVVYEGVISINSRGDGFIKQFDEQHSQVIREWFVFSTNLNGALNGDIITFHPMDKYNPNGMQNAVVKEVASRNKKRFVATYYKKTPHSYEIKIDDQKNYYEIELEDTSFLVDGQKILIEITTFIDNTKAKAKVLYVIGHINDIDSDILSVVYENGIEPQFEPQVLADVKHLKSNPQCDALRKDVSARDYMTIDPASSKDLDDAIYVKKINDSQYFLSVAIADVASYVTLDSSLDKAAYQRGTSVYLADRVIPMLPHLICNDWCSLNPQENKHVLVVDMMIDNNGNMHQIDLYPASMISKARFSYDDVNQYFKTKTTNNSFSPSLYQQLDEAYQLHLILRKKMQAAGYIDFNIKEPVIILDQENKVLAIEVKQHEAAQMMIEDFMVCANQAVTIKADELKMPFIYRTHNRPSREKLDKLAIEAKKLGFFVNPKDFDDITSLKISQWLAINKERFPNDELINKLILRSMEKATYEIENLHHFGLALKQYTHFTSPIRRYSDLIVHRLFWMYYFAPQLYTNEQREAIKHQLPDICEQCNALEVQAVKTEREVNAIKFVEYLGDRINQEFDGMISTITSFGIFVELKENTIEGLVRIKNIGGDFYEYNENNYTIVGKKHQKVFSFGQDVKVRVIGVDKLAKQIDLELVDFPRSHPEHFDRKVRAKNNNLKSQKFKKPQY